MNKPVIFITLLLIYISWVYIEHTYIKDKLEDISVFHIRELQKTYADNT